MLIAKYASHCANASSEGVREGLYRFYVECQDNLRFLRGRINFAEDLRQNLIARHRMHCTYADFTWDIEENQILRQVVHLLAGWNFDPTIRLRLSRLDNSLAEVSPMTLPASAISRFRYNRFNEEYRHPHQLCRLFLEGASLSEQLGVWDSRTFLVDMNKLFELFVTEVLKTRAKGVLSVSSQVNLTLAERDQIPIRPDIVIKARGRSVIVADCKYKRLQPGAVNNDDYYQVLAYCIATNAKRGLIIYPHQEALTESEDRIRNTTIDLERCAVDCGLPIDAIESECDRFAAYVFSKAEELNLLLSAN